MATFVTNHLREEELEELLTELVDAHVDTIELFVGRDDATTRAAHVDYLQGLVRHSNWLLAHRAGDAKQC